LKGEILVDTSIVTTDLARLQEANPQDDKYRFRTFETAESSTVTEGRSPQEIIIICFDNSGSMRFSADFSDVDRHEGTFKRVSI